MILIGSLALAVHGLRPMDEVRDIDLIGSRSEADELRAWLGSRVLEVSDRQGHHLTIRLRNGHRWPAIEIDYGQSPSDRMLEPLCSKPVKIFDRIVQVPPLEILYLIKRAHATVGIHHDKTFRDLLLLKPMIATPAPEQLAYARQLETECVERYARLRTRYQPLIDEADLAGMAEGIPYYRHADLHAAMALQTDGAPCVCCIARVGTHSQSITTFRKLPPALQRRTVCEEFMVTGFERYYVQNPSLPASEVYRLGMRKAIRDLFTGDVQRFCFDHLEQLVQPPAVDFIGQFEAAIALGRLRPARRPSRSIGKDHEHVWTLLQHGQIDDARRQAEDMVRRADPTGDPHAMFLLGAVLQITGFLPHAEQCLRASLAQDRGNYLGWMHLGLVLLKLGRKAEALDALDTGRRTGAQDASLFVALGMAYEENGRHQEAQEAYRHACAIDPAHPQAQEKSRASGSLPASQ